MEFQRAIATASLLSSTYTSHIVCFALKITTMASLVAEITGGTEINYMHTNQLSWEYAWQLQAVVHGAWCGSYC